MPKADVLALLNVSNHDDLACDSGYIFLRLLAEGLRGEGATLAVVGLNTGVIDGVVGYSSATSRTKYESRFSFDWGVVAMAIRETRPEVVLVGQPEHGSAVRAILEEARHPARLVTYCHYLPAGSGRTSSGRPSLDPSLNDGGLGLPIQLAVIGSCHVSDRVLVQSEYAARRLHELADAFGVPLPSGLVGIAPPPYDPELLSDGPALPPARLLYNHRLYRHYGTDFLVDLAEVLAERVEHELIVLDVLANRSLTRHTLDPYVRDAVGRLRGISTVRIVPGIGDRPAYRDLLHSVRVGLAPYRRASVWSMSTVDCLGMGVPVVAPALACFPEIIPRGQLYHDVSEAADQVATLLESADAWRTASERARAAVESLTPERTAQAVLAV